MQKKLTLGLIGLLMAAPMYATPSQAKSKPKPAPVAVRTAASAPVMPEWLTNDLELLLERQLAPRFSVEAGVLEDDLLATARQMSDEHVKRMREQLLAWAGEAVAQKSSTPFQYVHVRAAQAMAVWGLDSNGPEHDARLLKALQSGSACWRGSESNASELEARLQHFSSLPPAERAAAVDDERVLLARWGQVRAPAAHPPFAVADTLDRMRMGVAKPEPPLPPFLAHWYLASDLKMRRDAATESSPDLRCALHQWALRHALHGKDTTEAARRVALARWREATKVTATQLVWTTPEEAAKPMSAQNPYPRVASQFWLEGDITLELLLDRQGKLHRTRVVERKLRLPLLASDERPAAFEDLLDLPSIRKAQAISYPAKPDAPDERYVAEQGIRWSFKP